MKLYVENREPRMNVALFRHMACLLMDRFKDCDDEVKHALARIKNFQTRDISVKDIDGINVSIESGEEYGLHWFKVTASDSAYQLESDLMDLETWNTTWSWLNITPAVRAITLQEVVCDED